MINPFKRTWRKIFPNPPIGTQGVHVSGGKKPPTREGARGHGLPPPGLPEDDERNARAGSQLLGLTPAHPARKRKKIICFLPASRTLYTLRSLQKTWKMDSRPLFEKTKNVTDYFHLSVYVLFEICSGMFNIWSDNRYILFHSKSYKHAPGHALEKLAE